jgi:NADP-dependent 3-hydroxy acid dehydrogenase YdfG
VTQKLAGQVAWITGAGTGIGRAVAHALAEAGCRVALTGRSLESLEHTAAHLREAGADCLVAAADVGDRARLEGAHRSIRAAWGDVDILVNNAGFNLPRRHWHQLSADAVRESTATNLEGPMLAVLLVLPGMRAKRAGLLIQVASVSATGIFPVSGPAYIATKFGVRAMSATLHAEQGMFGIRSVCINPGEVDTPLLARRARQPTAEQKAKILQPEDVAQAVLFCATLPARACVTELTLVPTDDPIYRAEAAEIAARD